MRDFHFSTPLSNPVCWKQLGLSFSLLVLLQVGGCLSVLAQFEVPLPMVGTMAHAFSDTVYMSPGGDDSQPGTEAQPVKSFAAAVSLLPFGVEDVQGGDAFGLVRLLPGTYELTEGLIQHESMWKQGNTYRHVSIEGVGHVMIGGTASNPCPGNLIQLMGDHVMIRNLHLRHALGMGILSTRPYVDANSVGPKHWWIQGVTTDSVGSFGMLLRHIDTLLVEDCRVLRSARIGNEYLASPCQWPSGLKCYASRHATVRNCEVGYSRGEGLNFHNSRSCLAYGNRLHDNSANVYLDNSSKVIFRQNHLFNTPGLEALANPCPADPNTQLTGPAFLLANEGSCPNGQGATFNNCASNCLFNQGSFPTVDSVFLYNNFIQNTGPALSFWEGNTNIVGINCTKRVYFLHNTCIGLLGNPAGKKGFLYGFFPTRTLLSYATLSQVEVYGNIFSYDSATYYNTPPLRLVKGNLHPGPVQLDHSYNLWNQSFAQIDPTELVRPALPASFGLLEAPFSEVIPSYDSLSTVFVHEVPRIYDFVNKSFDGLPRQEVMTNVGAWEYRETASVNLAPQSSSRFQLYPNPSQGSIWIKSDELRGAASLRWWNAQGQWLGEATLNLSGETLVEFPVVYSPELLLLEIRSQSHREYHRLLLRP